MSFEIEETAYEKQLREISVAAVDAVTYFVYNIDLDEFADRVYKRGPLYHMDNGQQIDGGYVYEKWRLMNRSFVHYWGQLDTGMKDRFVKAALKWKQDGEEWARKRRMGITTTPEFKAAE